MFKLHKSQAGDSIVEVLLAIGVAAMVLVVSYTIMNRNLQTMQDNQDRTAASKIAQEQVEALKAAWQVGTSRADLNSATYGDNGFCFGPTDGELKLLSVASQPALDVAAHDPSAYDECTYNGIHQVGIKRSPAGVQGSYRIIVRWSKIGTDRTQQIILVYRLI